MSTGLWDPLDLGGGLRLRSRLFLPTHGTRLPQSRYLPYLAARAGQVAMVGVSASAGLVDLAFGPGSGLGGSSPGQFDAVAPWVEDDAAYEWHRQELAEQAAVIHDGGALAVGQLVHLGAVKHLEDLQPAVSPSGRRDGYRREQSHVLSAREVEVLLRAHAAAARRIRDAGLDAIELHAAHGYLLHQFLSPVWNQRDDEWAGAAFPLAVVAAVRDAVGDELPIGVRLGLGGSVVLPEVAGAFVAAGAAYLSVSGGSYTGWGVEGEHAYVAPEGSGEDLNVAAAATVRATVDVPVLVSGRIKTLAAAEAIVAGGRADAVGMVRALIAEPALGATSSPRPCIGANECHHPGRPVTCAVNPGAAREHLANLPRHRAHIGSDGAAGSRSVVVVVVGGGPAGVEAAVGAAEAGCQVVLLERAPALGGALLAQSAARPELRPYLDWLQGRPAAAGVDVRLGVDATPDLVHGFAPDVVAVATGAVEERLGPGVLVGSEVLTAAPQFRGPVAVVGGLEDGHGPIVVAEHLAATGHEVILLAETLVAGEGLEPATRVAAHRRLRRAGVGILALRRVIAAEPGLVIAADPLTGETHRIAAETVVDCSLRRPRDDLRFEGAVRIGDALAPRRLLNATLDGYRFGRELRLAPSSLSL